MALAPQHLDLEPIMGRKNDLLERRDLLIVKKLRATVVGLGREAKDFHDYRGVQGGVPLAILRVELEPTAYDAHVRISSQASGRHAEPQVGRKDGALAAAQLHIEERQNVPGHARVLRSSSGQGPNLPVQVLVLRAAVLLEREVRVVAEAVVHGVSHALMVAHQGLCEPPMTAFLERPEAVERSASSFVTGRPHRYSSQCNATNSSQSSTSARFWSMSAIGTSSTCGIITPSV